MVSSLAFPSLLNQLMQLGAGLPNLHVGIASSDVGSAGQAGVGGCSHGPNVYCRTE